MKVLLVAVNGSYTHTNLAVRCLRRELEKEGFSVDILERNLRDRTDYILSDIIKASEDVSLVGFSVYIWNARVMYELAADFKKLRPSVTVVMGGPEVSYDTDRFSGNNFTDCIICGEGEEHIVTLAKAVKNGEHFDGIYPVKICGNVMQDEGQLYRDGDYPNGSIIYYESSRGCPYSCAYCLSSATEGVRYKTPEQVFKDLKEFEKLPETIKIIKFVDRTFNAPAERANRIWKELLKPEYTKNYHFEVCGNLLNEESFEILSQLPKGKVQLEIGLQSTNEETLSEISRHLDAGTILKNVKRIHDMGNIHVHLDLIAGLPYESYGRFKKSFDDSYYTCDMLQLGFLKLLHGTRLRCDADKYGYVYMEKPPYTVLQSKWISYEELSRLSGIADILSRYSESGNFKQCVDYALEKTESPFDFFEGLYLYLESMGLKVRQLSQLMAFRHLYDYVSGRISAADLEIFSDKMHEDFAGKEAGRVPHYLRKK